MGRLRVVPRELCGRRRRRAGGQRGGGPANPQALNRYAYVLNNPVNATDPSGHCIFEPVEAVACAAVVAVAVEALVDAAPVVVGTYLIADGVQQTAQLAQESAAADAGQSVDQEQSNTSAQPKGDVYNRPATGKRPSDYRSGVTEAVRQKNNRSGPR